MLPTVPNLTSPEISRRTIGPCACTPIVSPTARCFFLAVSLSITTCLPCGQAPSTRVSGLKREAPCGMLKPRFGAPPKTIALPFLSIRWAPSLATFPSAARTSGRAWTRPSSDCGIVGAVEPLFVLVAALPVITASEPFRESVKIELNALSIESVSTNVPLTIATPRMIATAVRIVRSLRPRSPLSSARIMVLRDLAHRREDRRRRAPRQLTCDRAVGEEEHTVGDRRGLRVVRDHHHRLAEVGRRCPEQLEDGCARPRVEVSR